MFEDQLGLVGRIYEAVEDPELLDGVLLEILERTASGFMVLGLVDTVRAEPIFPRVIGDIGGRRGDGIAEYASGPSALDPTVAFCASRPGGRLFATDRAFTADEHARHPYTAWNRRYMGTSHWIARASDRERLGLVASVHPLSATDAHDERHRRLFSFLFDHLERAHRLAARAPSLAGEARAVVLLDAAGRVSAMSAPAEALLARKDGLRHAEGRVLPDDAAARKRLDAAVAQALAARALGGRSSAVPVPRPSGGRPLVVVVDPVPAQAGILGPGPGARLLIVDPDARAAASADRFAEAWGLTAAEARMADALLRTDCDLRAAADELGVTYATVRTQLARVFAKTDTRGQAELVRLLARVSG